VAKDKRELEEGTVVDNYRILSSLGQGGMGKVYLCEHIVLQKKYALKILTVAGDSDVHWRRFQAEARAISKLNHINIVRVHNMGVYQEELPYYVMDVLNGETLKDKINREGPLSELQTIDIFLAVCAGLDYAHRSEIVHRDIKPSNIMIVTDQREQTVKLVDFGLVKTIGETQGMTATGEILGSPFYMSPEQASGQRIGYGSDLYSVGISLFETLTGTVPFKGQNAMQTILMHAQKTAPTLQSAAPQLQFSEAMESCVAFLLQKSAADRYMTAAELKDDLIAIKRTRELSPRSPALKTKSSNYLKPDSSAPLAQPLFQKQEAKGEEEEKDDNYDDSSTYSLDTTDSTSTQRYKIIGLVALALVAIVSSIAFVAAMINAPVPVGKSANSGEPVSQSSTVVTQSKNEAPGTAEMPFGERKTLATQVATAEVKPYFVRNEGANRLFRFPDHHNLGVFNLTHNNIIWPVAPDSRGFIVVPEGTELVLIASNDLHTDLKLLDGFNDGDLGGVNLSNCVSHIKELLLKLARLKSISYIDLSKTDVTDSEISLLSNFPALTCLKVNVTNLSPAAVTSFSGFEKIHLFEYKDCARAAELVQRLKGHANIGQLAINNCKIENGVCQQLAALPKLNCLLASGCNLTASQIKELLKIKQLKALILRKQSIGLESIDDLRKIAERCRVEISAQPYWTSRDLQRLCAARPSIRIVKEAAGHDLENKARSNKHNDWLNP
jgi:serine/threonine protein kinase